MSNRRKMVQKEFQFPKEVYREIGRLIQESKNEFVTYPNLSEIIMDDIGCMNRLFKILEQNRHYQEVLLTACIEYLTSGKCPGQEIEPLKKAINKFMIYTLEIEKFFEFIDWKSYFYERLEIYLQKNMVDIFQ
ncbi:hypothetical protein [Butyricimonas paravirosa]|uniref:hypothetical protein n=1 Tax=Butyricimonas paravirosa TaxID=1472417 RepID=UPI002A816414|nr:hypothetical protein [Butyricimonas paravirosa]